MTMKAMIAAVGLAASALTAPGFSQVIGGDVDIDGSRDDVVFLGGDMNVSGRIEGDVSGIAGEALIDGDVTGSVEIFGGDIEVRGTVGESVEIAGGDIDISADVVGDVNAAGGDVGIRGAIGGEVNAAGGNVVFSGSAGDGVNLGGGYVEISQGSEIGSNSNIVGGEVDLHGTYQGYVEIEAGEVTLHGRFLDTVEVTAEEVNIASGAVITGELRVRAPSEPNVADGAEIGSVDYQFEAFNFGAKHWEDIDIDFDGPWHVIGAPFEFLGGAFAGSAFILGMLAVLLAPRGVSNIARSFRTRPVSSGALGFITFALSPVILVSLTVLLAITVIGVFLIPLLWVLYFPILFLAFAFGAIVVGDLIFNRSGGDRDLGLGMRALSLLLVLAATMALGVVTGLGFIVGLILMCIGLGSWILSFGKRRASDDARYNRDRHDREERDNRRREPEHDESVTEEAPDEG